MAFWRDHVFGDFAHRSVSQELASDLHPECQHETMASQQVAIRHPLYAALFVLNIEMVD